MKHPRDTRTQTRKMILRLYDAVDNYGGYPTTRVHLIRAGHDQRAVTKGVAYLQRIGALNKKRIQYNGRWVQALELIKSRGKVLEEIGGIQ
jgi:hypothetical protein